MCGRLLFFAKVVLTRTLYNDKVIELQMVYCEKGERQ